MPSTPTLQRSRARIARAARYHDDAELIEARRDYAADKIADYIERVVAEAPPLTPEQRERLAALLGGGS